MPAMLRRSSSHTERRTLWPRSKRLGAFVSHLRAGSRSPVVFAELPHGQHSFDLFHSLRFSAVVDGIEAFAAWVRTTSSRYSS
jgi:hypothetical protein